MLIARANNKYVQVSKGSFCIVKVCSWFFSALSIRAHEALLIHVINLIYDSLTLGLQFLKD